MDKLLCEMVKAIVDKPDEVTVNVNLLHKMQWLLILKSSLLN